MNKRQLGNTDIQVSEICLGTMTWGEQNSQDQAFSQMDYALERGINFFDTAEMYPVPPRGQTQGSTETIVGNWLAKTGKRDKIVLASKVSGRGSSNAGLGHLRDGPRLSAEHVREAIEDSLRRLQTDYLDLYQVHWPERSTNFFGKLGYRPSDNLGVPIQETLETLGELVKAGKVRHIGLSNETPWGFMEYCRLADKYELPRIVSVQNPYNLLNRSYEVGLAEMSIRENIGLLAYSPLAFGVLSGKYLQGQRPEGARITLFDRFVRYQNPYAEAATQAYVDLARAHDMNPVAMALAFVTSRAFVTSNIIGATTLEQLAENIDSSEVTLSEEVLAGIEAIHQQYSNPAP